MKTFLSQTDWVKIGKGALVALAGALLTYATVIVPNLNIPEGYLPLITAVLGVLANIIRKYATS